MTRVDRQLAQRAGGKGTGGSFVAATDDRFFVHTRLKGTRAFNLDTGLKTAFMPSEPVLHNGLVYSAETSDEHPVVRAWGPDDKALWEVDTDGSGIGTAGISKVLKGCVQNLGPGVLCSTHPVGMDFYSTNWPARWTVSS